MKQFSFYSLHPSKILSLEDSEDREVRVSITELERIVEVPNSALRMLIVRKRETLYGQSTKSAIAMLLDATLPWREDDSSAAGIVPRFRDRKAQKSANELGLSLALFVVLGGR